MKDSYKETEIDNAIKLIIALNNTDLSQLSTENDEITLNADEVKTTIKKIFGPNFTYTDVERLEGCNLITFDSQNNNYNIKKLKCNKNDTSTYKTKIMHAKKYNDRIEIEEKAIKLNNKLVSDDCEGMKAHKIAQIIEHYKDKIKTIFFETQNLIYSSYFNQQFYKISTTADIDEYRVRLYNYKNYIGISDNYSDFNDFYINKMMDLDNKYESIMNNTSLTVVNNSRLGNFFRKIRSLLSATIVFKKD